MKRDLYKVVPVSPGALENNSWCIEYRTRDGVKHVFASKFYADKAEAESQCDFLNEPTKEF